MLRNLPRLSPITQDWSPDKPQLIDNACEGGRLREGEKRGKKKKKGSRGEQNELYKQNWEDKGAQSVTQMRGK